MNKYPDFYNDVFGPVMQPFSSAHTAGPCRMGYLTNNFLDDEVKRIRVSMNPESSWHATFGLQNEDLAFLSGITGHLPNEKIMFEMREYCKANEIEYAFVFDGIEGNNHHSGACITLTGKSGKEITTITESLGGGLVRVRELDGYEVDFRGETYVFLIFCPKGENIEKIRERLRKAAEDVESLKEGISENSNGDCLIFAETSKNPGKLKTIFPDFRTEILKPVTAVVKNKNIKPQLFATVYEWKAYAAKKHISMAEAAIEYEMASSSWTREEVVSYMKNVIAAKMYRASHVLYEEEVKLPKNPFFEPRHVYWKSYIADNRSFAGEVIEKALFYAYSALTGVPGVEFIPGPMGTGGGMIYSVLSAAREERGYSEEALLDGLFVAAGIGAICCTHSEPGGGNVGCMGEMGMCGAMAAAGVTAMAGGTPDQIESAAAMSMMIAVGWPCDPTSGAKGMPCVARAMQIVSMALVFSDVARSGQDAVFSFQDVLETADRMGRILPETCRASELGGHCICETGKKCMESFNQWHQTL